MTGIAMHLDLQGFAELAALWAEAPDIAREELTAAATEATLLLERETRERTPVGIGAGGGLRGSIAARPVRIEGAAVVGETGTALDYAIPVELGSRPHFPPIQPIRDWVRFKLDVPAGDVARVAYAVAAKIAREGTEGAHMFRDAFAVNEAQVAGMFAGAVTRIRDRLGDVEAPSGGPGS